MPDWADLFFGCRCLNLGWLSLLGDAILAFQGLTRDFAGFFDVFRVRSGMEEVDGDGEGEEGGWEDGG
jgi:hypothetical protein